MHVLLHSVPPTLQQATTNPRLHWRLLDTHRQVWVSLVSGVGGILRKMKIIQVDILPVE